MARAAPWVHLALATRLRQAWARRASSPKAISFGANPAIVHLDNDAFRADGYLKVTTPISASFAICDVTLPKLRYVCDPELPALQGTTKLAA